mgnify:CR=1 FL=1
MSYTLNPSQVPKPNQEVEKKQIEEILRNEFGIESRILIYASGISLNEFDELLIISTSKYTETFYKAKANLNGKFKKFGINHVYYVCEDA